MKSNRASIPSRLKVGTKAVNEVLNLVTSKRRPRRKVNGIAGKRERPNALHASDVAPPEELDSVTISQCEHTYEQITRCENGKLRTLTIVGFGFGFGIGDEEFVN